MHEAQRQFPGSKIFLAQIAYSNRLTVKEQETLADMNSEIKSLDSKQGVYSIPRIPSSQFSVGSDDIHWTENCARSHLQHYNKHLN